MVPKFITVCDLYSAYHQIGVKADEQDKTDFVTHKGKWIFKRLPFGIANAPFLFARMMSSAFSHFGPRSGLLVYMDDIICCSSTWESHLTLLESMLQALQDAGLTLKPSKYSLVRRKSNTLAIFCRKTGFALGKIVSKLLPTCIHPKRLKNFVQFWE